jgi:chromosome segregation ATPase
MSDGTELERRIHAALDRIAAAADGLSAQAGDDGSLADLQAALDAERSASAQLEERVRAIKEKQETVVGRLEREVADLKAALAVRDATVQKVRRMNGLLRKTNRALRAANAQHLPDPELINGALEAELDALRTLQESDRAELDEIIATLEPVVKEVRHA